MATMAYVRAKSCNEAAKVQGALLTKLVNLPDACLLPLRLREYLNY